MGARRPHFILTILMAVISFANTALERRCTCWLLFGVVFVLLNFTECNTVNLTPSKDAVKPNGSGSKYKHFLRHPIHLRLYKYVYNLSDNPYSYDNILEYRHNIL